MRGDNRFHWPALVAVSAWTREDLIDRRDARAFACRVPDGVVGVDGAPEVEDGKQHEHEQREDESELDERLATSVAPGVGPNPHGVTVITVDASHASDVPESKDWCPMV
jgi:hypothetical protein